jgi:hypothetical protein
MEVKAASEGAATRGVGVDESVGVDEPGRGRV